MYPRIQQFRWLRNYPGLRVGGFSEDGMMKKEELTVGYPCTFFMAPDGHKRNSPITKMEQADYDWFLKYGAELSGEVSGDDYVFYADVGCTQDDGETPDEAMIITKESDCPYEQFHKLRLAAEAKMS